MDKYRMNDVEIWTPDKNLVFKRETTYTNDSGRDMWGEAWITPMFTNISSEYKATNVPKDEIEKIARIIKGGGFFNLHYFDANEGKWKDGVFYSGTHSITIQTLKENEEKFTITFSMIGKKAI